jgi:hypothetical protein
VNTRSLLCACAAAAAMMISAMPMMANTPTTTKTNVPFAFVASGKTMPAGQYTLAKNSENVLSVRNAAGDTTFAVVTRQVGSLNSATPPKLIFVKKNGQYHLSEIYLANSTGGQQIPVK